MIPIVSSRFSSRCCRFRHLAERSLLLHSDYEEALHEVFRDYTSAMAFLHHHHAGEKSTIEPRQRRWQELFLTLKAIEQDL